MLRLQKNSMEFLGKNNTIFSLGERGIQLKSIMKAVIIVAFLFLFYFI